MRVPVLVLVLVLVCLCVCVLVCACVGAVCVRECMSTNSSSPACAFDVIGKRPKRIGCLGQEKPGLIRSND